jgi:hypothetical protein
MLFKILKLFGVDVPARIEALKSSLEQRIDHATDHVKQVAQQAAVIAALLAVAAVTGAFAIGIGLLALYWWLADDYGPFIGLAVVGGLLVAATIALAVAATMKGKSLAPGATVRANIAHPGVTAIASATGPAGAGPELLAQPAVAAAPVAHGTPADGMPTAAAATASASDLAEPLAFILSRVVKYPSLGNPLIDELIENLRLSARGATGEAIERAANVIRRGDRPNMIFVLAGAAFVGWLLARQRQPRS